MKKRIIISIICLVLIILVSGCGPEKLISLTDSERAQIASFSAHLIGEFNRQMTEGYTSLSYGQLKSIKDSMRQEENPVDEPVNPDEPDDNDDDNGGGGSGGTTDGGTMSLSELIGTNGITGKYNGFFVQEDYVYNRALSVNKPSDPENTYFIMKIVLTNNTTEDILCDIFSNALKLTLSVNNGSAVANATATILPIDFVNYMDTIKAGESVETYIFFEIKKSIAESVSDFKLISTKNNISKTIGMN